MTAKTGVLIPDRMAAELTRWRRDLHRRAELSGAETRTQEYLDRELRACGYRPRRAGTGLIADWRCRRAVRSVAFRADMDALPLREETGVDFASETEGVCHACGHDGHMAMLLGLAACVAERRPALNVRFLFQPREERGGGAQDMIDAGALEGVDLIFGAHLTPELPAGVAATIAGGLFAGTCDFSVEFTGRSSHIADAGRGVDALAAAVACYERSYARWRAGYLPHTRYGVGRLCGGAAHNIVPGAARLEGTFRYYDDARKEAFFMDFERILDALRAETGVEHRFEAIAVYPPLVNTPRLTEYLSEELGLASTHARWTAEDFACYLERVPGMYYWLGVGDADADALHSPKFNFDERILLEGLGIDLAIAERAERGEI